VAGRRIASRHPADWRRVFVCSSLPSRTLFSQALLSTASMRFGSQWATPVSSGFACRINCSVAHLSRDGAGTSGHFEALSIPARASIPRVPLPESSLDF
jgi:hypothetical protein